jgi:CHAD domain-containing protein
MAARRRAKARGDLSPAATVAARAIEVVARQSALVRANLAAAIDGRDPEGVHDMRVASRRLRAALGVLAPWLPGSDLARVNPGLRAVTRALGDVREIDVNRALLARARTRATPVREVAIEDVDARLARRLRRARVRMMARFARVDLDRLDERLARLVAHLRRATPPMPPAAATGAGAASAPDRDTASAGPPIDAWFFPGPSAATETEPAGQGTPARHPGAPIAELLREAGARAEAAAIAIVSHPVPSTVGTPEAHEALHSVRIAAKKLRYLMEIVSPELGPAGGALVRRLRGLQDHLGEFHDEVVLDAQLADAIRRATRRGRRLLAAELRRLRRVRHRALLRDERAVRAVLDDLRGQDFAGDLRRAFEEALSPRPAGEGQAEATPGDAPAVRRG